MYRKINFIKFMYLSYKRYRLLKRCWTYSIYFQEKELEFWTKNDLSGKQLYITRGIDEAYSIEFKK